MFKDKRGVEILSTEVLYLLAALIFIAIIAGAAFNVYRITSAQQEKSQALGTLDRLNLFLENLDSPGETGTFLMYVPKGYRLTYHPSISPKSDPFTCANGPCACICQENTCTSDKTYCKPVSKPLNLLAANEVSGIRFIIISVNELTFRNDPTSYVLTQNFAITQEIADYTFTTEPGVKVTKLGPIPAPERSMNIRVDTVVLHHTGSSSAQQTYFEFSSNPLKKSLHYIIDQNGTTYYLVDEKRKAVHSGDEDGTDTKSLGIGLVNNGVENFTNAQYDSLNLLLDDIVRRYGFVKKDNQHIIGNYETVTGARKEMKSPPANFNWSRIGLPDHKKP